jgi:hypothetical protein
MMQDKFSNMENPKPERVQRSRKRGATTPPHTKYVGRPTAWGNPYSWEVLGREEAVSKYEQHIAGREAEIRSKLKGMNLSCWCPVGAPCHADILLRIANEAPGTFI